MVREKEDPNRGETRKKTIDLESHEILREKKDLKVKLHGGGKGTNDHFLAISVKTENWPRNPKTRRRTR